MNRSGGHAPLVRLHQTAMLDAHGRAHAPPRAPRLTGVDHLHIAGVDHLSFVNVDPLERLPGRCSAIYPPTEVSPACPDLSFNREVIVSRVPAQTAVLGVDSAAACAPFDGAARCCSPVAGPHRRGESCAGGGPSSAPVAIDASRWASPEGRDCDPTCACALVIIAVDALRRGGTALPGAPASMVKMTPAASPARR
jgi:hypothetical protein